MKKFTHPALNDMDTGEPVFINIPSKRIICPSCGGFGVHDRTDLDMSKLVDSMVEDGDDEGLDRYYSGAYDAPCSQCDGDKVVDEFDWDYLKSHHPKELSKIQDYDQSAREDERYARSERAALGY